MCIVKCVTDRGRESVHLVHDVYLLVSPQLARRELTVYREHIISRCSGCRACRAGTNKPVFLSFPGGCPTCDSYVHKVHGLEDGHRGNRGRWICHEQFTPGFSKSSFKNRTVIFRECLNLIAAMYSRVNQLTGYSCSILLLRCTRAALKALISINSHGWRSTKVEKNTHSISTISRRMIMAVFSELRLFIPHKKH